MPLCTWAEAVDEARDDPDRAEAVDALVGNARAALERPIVRRAYKMADVTPESRLFFDGRSHQLPDEIKETFILAMSDALASRQLDEVATLAAAWRLTDDERFKDRALAQLVELSSWSPLQRSGWGLCHPDSRLPPGGRDGNWLGTGGTMGVLAKAFDLLTPEALPADLLAAFEQLFAAEIADILADWELKRPWFVKNRNPITNQWVLPTQGLIHACLLYGPERCPDALELGVSNMIEALDAHGASGEFEEGAGYAAGTVMSMLAAAHSLALTGDRRLVDHPFLANFPTWLVHHFQPAETIVNCFDCGSSRGSAGSFRPLLSMLVVCTGSETAQWALEHMVDGPSDDLAGLVAGGFPAGYEEPPPLYAAYERATRVNWRSCWDDAATGLWLRGGHETDQHDHQDRGHVNFVAHGQPIFIEAGTPAYHNLRMRTHYSFGSGHNVLQIGAEFPPTAKRTTDAVAPPGWQKAGTVAPLTVRRLDGAGGDVKIDGSAGYDELEYWFRDVEWDANTLVVRDDLRLHDGGEQIILFRWHLGVESGVAIAGDGRSRTVHWHGVKLTLGGSAPLQVTQEMMPDATLTPARKPGEEEIDHEHVCLVVQTVEPVNSMFLRTRVDLA